MRGSTSSQLREDGGVGGGDEGKTRDSRLSTEFDLAPEVDKGGLRVRSGSIIVIMSFLFHEVRARAFDDSESN